MKNTENQGDRQALLGERLSLQRQANRPWTVAEYYLLIGRVVRYQLRHGQTLDTVARRIHLPISECLLALQYAEGPDWLKLRAMVENWSWRTIKDCIRSAQAPSQRACHSSTERTIPRRDEIA